MPSVTWTGDAMSSPKNEDVLAGKTYRIDALTVSESNRREHWTKRAKRAKAQRALAFISTPQLPPCRVKFIVLIRDGGRQLDDDNLRSALKAIRDGIADKLRIGDGDPSIRWFYGQQPSSKRRSSVKVELGYYMSAALFKQWVDGAPQR